MTDTPDTPEHNEDRPDWAKPNGPLRSFGRIKSRPIKAKQAALFDTLMPTRTVQSTSRP